MIAARTSITGALFKPLRLPFTPEAALIPPLYQPHGSDVGCGVNGAGGEGAYGDHGPDPYLDYSRRYTPEDGIAFTYKTIDESGWRTVVRVLALLFVLTMAFAYQVDGSPYPILPHGCRPLGSCPVEVPAGPLMINLLLLAALGCACFWILFTEVQVYREIEIRPDCMILDGTEVFRAEKFELGWPRFITGDEGMLVLAGVYGTRQTEFLKLKAFDENDRTPAVFAQHLAEAMRQQWEPPGSKAAASR